MNEDFHPGLASGRRGEGEPQQPREVGPEGARLGVSCVCAVQGLQGKSNSYYNRKGRPRGCAATLPRQADEEQKKRIA